MESRMFRLEWKFCVFVIYFISLVGFLVYENVLHHIDVVFSYNTNMFYSNSFNNYSIATQ